MCIYIRVVLSFVLRLGTGITGQKRRVRRRKKGKGERVEGRKGHGEEEEDRLVARIRFRTVSNDTGQDTTMFSKILIPRHLFLHSFLLLFLSSFFPLFLSFFFLFLPFCHLFGAVMGLYERFVEVVSRVGMKRAP